MRRKFSIREPFGRFQFSIERGFTLVEILVSVSIIITATTVVVAILTSSFRASTKTTSVELVRQNGGNAMNQMSRTIQFAEGFEGASVDDSGPSSYDAVCPVGTKTYHYIQVRSAGVNRKLSCTDSGITLDGASLLDMTKVQITPLSCKFTCSQANSSVSPVIGISFSLLQNSTSTLPEKKASIDFSTSIKMRNL